MSALRFIQARWLTPALLMSATSVAAAQLANASSAATGLSGAYTAGARGYNAILWNPANLAMPGNPGFSFVLMALDGIAGLKPIDLSDIAAYQGRPVPVSAREQWMADVAAQSGQKGALNGGITPLALSIGSLGLQVSTKVVTDASLAPDAVEALLFGNAGRTGTVKNLQLAGSSFQALAYSTGAVSLGVPLPNIGGASHVAVGATVKYTVAHAMAVALDDGSAIGTNAVKVLFPAIYTNPDSANGNAGSGMGLDLGIGWTTPGFSFGLSLQNVFNAFSWDTAKLTSTSASMFFGSDTSYEDTKDQPYASAPAALRERVADLKFKPVIAAGVAFNWLPRMTVSADIRQRIGEGIEVGPRSTIAGGIEYRIIPFIPLRAGLSIMTGGWGVSGGVGIHLLGLEVGAAGFLRQRDGGKEPGVTLNVFSIRP